MRKFEKSTIVTFLVLAILVSSIPTTLILNSKAATTLGDPVFSIIQISDTQFLSASYPQLYNDTVSWIVNNSAAYNLKMVIHTGDIVDNINGTSGTYSDPTQWNNANAAMSMLLNAGIPYCWDAGNHDQIPWNDANGTWIGSSYPAFNATNMHSQSYWVSDFFDSKNTATRFTYNGYDFLIINLEYMATNATLNWMKNLIDNNQRANVIIAAHTYLNKGGGYGFSSAGLPGEVAWCTNFKTILDGYSNIFLTLSGHDPTGTANMTLVGNREQIFFDRQGINNQTGAAAVRVYTFNLANMQVNTLTYAYNLTSRAWNWLTDVYNQFSFNVTLSSNDWVVINNARSVKAYPDLREYVWQKNATMTPNGLYDKIGLHRLVNSAVTSKGVIFINPGTYGNGGQLTSNPFSDNYTKTENDSIAIYWANRGFDVYVIDYRTHFVPITLSASQLGFMANWGWDQWISDIREAVTKVKQVSGVDKLFMVGFSFGGFATMNYATIYGKEDLQGIVLLDGGYTAKNQNYNSTNTYNLTSTVSQINATGIWGYEYPNLPNFPPQPSGALFTTQFIVQNPNAPANIPGTNQSLPPPINPLTNKTWTNITEWYNFVQSGPFSNTLGGYGNVTVNLQNNAYNDRYWPKLIYAEMGAYKDWTNCPYVAQDFDDKYKDINVPLLGFSSELFGIPTFGNLTNGIGNTDFMTKLLPKYGHLDVVQGPYSARDVSQPTYQWLLNHTLSALITQGTSATIATRSSITLSANVSGGPTPYTYQWYQDGNAIVGQILPQINVGWTFAGTHTLYCSVTDAIAMTVNTTALTLTVSPAPTPTPIPTTPTQTPTPTTAPTPTPVPITTPDPTATPQITSTPTITPSTTASPSNLTNTETYAIVAIIAILVIIVAAVALVYRKRAKKPENK